MTEICKKLIQEYGCGRSFYRIAVVVIVEENDSYLFFFFLNLNLIASEFCFGNEPMDYWMADIKCRGENVMIPNSMVFSYIDSQNIFLYNLLRKV